MMALAEAKKYQHFTNFLHTSIIINFCLLFDKEGYIHDFL